MKYNRLLLYAVVFLVLCGIVYYGTLRRASIDDVWFINLDRDTKRLDEFMKVQDRFGVPVHRWAATYGRDVNRTFASKTYGVCTSITRSNDSAENQKNPNVLHQPGVIGCWISHKRLLMHLNTLPVPNYHGHLITEDDILVPHDFQDRWNTIRKTIPYDWDIVYLYTGMTRGDPIAPNLLRAKNDAFAGNTGTVAYVVRHGVLPQMLHELRFMNSPIDVQYYKHFGHLNVYIVHPSLIETGDAESSIAVINNEK